MSSGARGAEAAPRALPPALDLVARLRLAARLRALGLLLERPRPGWWEELRQVSEEVADPRLTEAVLAAEGAGEGEYLAALGPGGELSPRATGHSGITDPGHALAALCGLYEAFAFDPRGEDPPDHIATQVGFFGYLALKGAYAASSGQIAEARLVDDAAELFLAAHLSGFAEAFAERVDGSTCAPRHLRLATSLLRQLVGPSCPDARG